MSNPYHAPKQGDRGSTPKGPAGLIVGAVMAAIVALAIAAFFVWGAHYWLANTPFMGQFSTPPVPSAKFIGGLTCVSIPIGLLAVLISFVFAREAIRRF